MNVLITGSTGMIGKEILKICKTSDKVSSITLLNRKSVQTSNPKVRNVVISDFLSYDEQDDVFQDIQAAFFCIGVYTGSVSDELFKTITVDYAVEFAKKLQANSPTSRLCLLSGAGADRSEKSSTSFAKYKGMAENAISEIGIEFYTFRPGYIYPVDKREEPNFLYALMRYLYPVIRLFGSNSSIKSNELALGMFNAGLNGHSQEILENKNILELANYRVS